MKQINGGVTAAKGFTAAGIHCGVKSQKAEKKDVALIFSECECSAAAVYTLNCVKAAPIYATMQNLENGKARAVVCNSGNANACAPLGSENARKMCAAAAAGLGIAPEDVIVASTGVIGQTINIAAIETGMPKLCAALSKDGSRAAAEAIMTTDTVKKEIAVSFELGGKTVALGGIAKGSGMIHPNMGTMLAFITTDAAITSEMLHEALTYSARRTFNRISVDGDTSTNDMSTVMANGLAGNKPITEKNADFDVFVSALCFVCERLAKLIAGDGEGASRLVACRVYDSRSEDSAEKLAMSIISSSLVKAAMFGADANWGRVLCAMGYSKAPFRPEFVDVYFKSAAGTVKVCQDGMGLEFDEELAKKILVEKEVTIDVDLKEGCCEATAWGCDLTYDYVKINGDYRT